MYSEDNMNVNENENENAAVNSGESTAPSAAAEAKQDTAENTAAQQTLFERAEAADPDTSAKTDNVQPQQQAQPRYQQPQQTQQQPQNAPYSQVPSQNSGEYSYVYSANNPNVRPQNAAQNAAQNPNTAYTANAYRPNGGYTPGNTYGANGYGSNAYSANNAYTANTAYNAGGAYNNGNMYSSVPSPADNGSKRKAKKAKRQGGMSAGAVAVLLVVCILLSGAAGFGGAILASKLTGNSDDGQSKLILDVGGKDNSNSGGDSSVIYKSVTPEENKGTSSDSTAIANVAAKASDCVVEIVTEAVETSSFFGNYITSGAGSGVIISEDGYIITCAHVIENATAITVKMTDGMSYDAALIGSDSVTDIGVIKINVTGLPHAIIGDSDRLVVGEDAIAIGNPLGELGGTVTNGIISALDREVEIDSQKYNVLQTNAAINPGNSGGGLFNINAELIGIVNAKSSGSGIEGLGFAIPINDAVYVAEQLISYGYIKGRPALGVYVCEILDSQDYWSLRSSENAAILNYVTEYGVYFTEYNTELQQEGGLEFGDRIIAIDGISVSTLGDVKALLNSEYHVGDKVKITVARVTDFKRGRTEMTDVELTLVENTPSTPETEN